METISNSLIQNGVDVNGVISRLGGNELLYLSICKKFLYDKNFYSLKESLVTNDLRSAEIHIHTLKGVAANLGFLRIEYLCKIIQEDLKKNDLQSIRDRMGILSIEYNKIISVLKEEITYPKLESPHETL
jgi:HPt (histidine-containing phosphotransfer) domain-containing protein